MFRRFVAAAVAVIALSTAGAAAAQQQATLGVFYSATGVVPGGTVDLTFSVYTDETASTPMSNGAFTYTVPAGLTATSVAGSAYCPATTVNLVGNVLTVSGMTQPISYICAIRVTLQADTLGTYPLAATTLTYSTPLGGSFTSTPGTSLTVTYAPVISSLSPASGSLTGGESVVITGANFTGATSVTFGGIPAAFVVNSSTQITATTPAAAKGARNVKVTGISGANPDTATNVYVYAEPVPTLSEWALTLMGMALAGMAALFVKRRAA